MRFLLYIFTGAYAIAGIFLHRQVSNLAVGRYPQLLGDFVPREHSVEGSFILLGIVLAFVGYKLWKGERRRTTLLYWFLYAVALVFFYMFISLHPVEVIHLVQYISVVYLIGLCIDRKREQFLLGKILFVACAIGVVDEIIQYFVLHPFQKYLDFGDFVVNALGAIGGVLIFYGFHRAPTWEEKPLPPLTRTRGFRELALLTLVYAVVWGLGYVDSTPPDVLLPGYKTQMIGQQRVVFLERTPGYLGSWQPHFVSGKYYSPAPFEGMLLTLALPLFFATFDPRFLRQIRECKG